MSENNIKEIKLRILELKMDLLKSRYTGNSLNYIDLVIEIENLENRITNT